MNFHFYLEEKISISIFEKNNHSNSKKKILYCFQLKLNSVFGFRVQELFLYWPTSVGWGDTSYFFYEYNFFLFVRIGSWNFQHMFESSQNNSLFRQHSDDILWEIKVVQRSRHFVRFMKSVIKRMLKISAFYLDKQKSLIPKKNWSLPFLQAGIVF